MLIPLDIFADIATDNFAQMRVASSVKAENEFMGLTLATSSLLLVCFQVCKRLAQDATNGDDARSVLQFARDIAADAIAADLSRSLSDTASVILEAVAGAEAELEKRWPIEH